VKVLALMVFVCPRCTMPVFGELLPEETGLTKKFAAVIVFTVAMLKVPAPLTEVPTSARPPTLNVPPVLV